MKRGTWGTIDEILGACERIMFAGNKKVIICLRGVVGMPSYRHVFPSIRWAPDLMMIPALRELTNIPIIYGILTTYNYQQALERSDPNKKNKGGAAAQALLHLLGISKDQNETK